MRQTLNAADNVGRYALATWEHDEEQTGLFVVLYYGAVPQWFAVRENGLTYLGGILFDAKLVTLEDAYHVDV